MNKKLRFGCTLALALSCTTSVSCGVISKASAEPITTYFVDFFDNYLREDFTLSNGTKARGNNLIYQTVETMDRELIQKPVDPTRKNYEFQGWYKDTDCTEEWNFATDIVDGHTRLYAKWGIGEIEVEPEPPYTPPSTVLDNSAATDYEVRSVMYSTLKNNTVKVTKAALLKLEASKTNVLPLMEYKVKAGKTITATYENKVITLTCGSTVQNINVVDDSNEYIVGNTTYENKAKKYEENAVEEESHHVMLAGSSSIEFWENSKEDMQPVISYNHGIGGTTIEEWDEKLNQRLVYPYKPKMVVYYVGINNVINSKESADTIWEHLEQFFDNTHTALPDTKVQYIMMNLIPNYKDYFPVINDVNARVVAYQQSHQWLTLINPGTALLKENGQPNAAYFRTDGLHLSHYGYVVWGGIIKESILNGLENM
jgi:uncharacterized repeat protein (TIGR02543 family)